MMRSHLPLLALGVASATIAASCSNAPEEARAQAFQGAGNGGAAESVLVNNEITIRAADFHYQAPDTIPAGVTTIRLINDGPELHHVLLVRIDDGHTLDDMVKAASAGGPAPAWMHFVGGPNTPVPGGESISTVRLEPGNYAIICLIPSPDGVPHLKKGMVRPLTVVGGAGHAGRLPRADARMVLVDYAFGITPITAGRHTIRVENAAAQPHEVLIVRLAPGKTAQDMADWALAMQGPPPGAPIGGTTDLDRGEVNIVTADFEPGEYALLCFVPDVKDGKPHTEHGMIRQITVAAAD